MIRLWVFLSPPSTRIPAGKKQRVLSLASPIPMYRTRGRGQDGPGPQNLAIVDINCNQSSSVIHLIHFAPTIPRLILLVIACSFGNLQRRG